MAAKVLLLALLVLSIYLSSSFSFIEALAINGGFSIDLIHRDSSLSPFYNPLETASDRLKGAVRRSIARSNHFKPTSTSPDQIESTVISSSGEYLMKVSIGTPPVETLAIADTGSDLIWTQCKPCQRCYKQKSPLFDPLHSSSYRDLSCSSRACESLEKSTCSDGTCKYSYSYGDQSFTNGNLAIELFTLGSSTRRSVSIPKVVFGCGHNNDGTFNETGSGLIGLGGGPLSLISQLGSTIGGKFSYCLVPFSSDSTTTSKMHFGNEAVVSGKGVVSTPLATKEPNTFYFLTLEAMSVGNKRLAYKSSTSTSKISKIEDQGNIIIDSGTTLTLLPSEFYYDLEAEVKKAINLQPVQDPQGVLNLCYESSTTDIKFPTITAHFTGADLVLQAMNTFVRIEGDLICFVMIPVDDTGIFGNLSQMNMLVGYDVEGKKVSFKQTDCTKQ